MFESLKKNAIKKVTVSSIVMIIIGIVLLVFQGREAYYAITGPRTFEDLTPGEIRNHMIVDVTLTGTLPSFGEESQKTSAGTNLGTTAYYYGIYTGGEDETTDYALMGIKVPSRYRASMDKLAKYYSEYGWSDTPLHFRGEIRKMNSDELAIFKDAVNCTETEFKMYCLPYVVDANKDLNSLAGMAYVFTLGGIVLLVIATVRLIRAATGACLKKLKQDIADSGYTDASVESDYSTATSYLKSGEVKVGRLFTYYMSGSTPRLILNSKLLWAYQSTVTHRRNGINVGTTYSVMLYVDGNKNNINLPMPNEAVTRQMLQKIDATLPWVVVGYSDELKRMFNNDRAHFLELRYNQVEHVAVEPGFENMNI